MTRTTTVRARIEPGLKSDVEGVLSRLGVSTTDAITMFFSQIRLRRGFPFPVEIPNEVTRRTFEATDRGEGLHEHDSIDAMFKALEK